MFHYATLWVHDAAWLHEHALQGLTDPEPSGPASPMPWTESVESVQSLRAIDKTATQQSGERMMDSTPAQIRKQVILRAPLQQVWRALTQGKAFGAWFGMELNGDFVPDTVLRGRIAATEVDPEVAALQRPYVGVPFELRVERMEPMRLLSFRWHPGAVEPGVDYSKEPMTLVTFELEELAQVTRLTLTESGFDRLAVERATKAREGNERGWDMQLKLIAAYLARHVQPALQAQAEPA
jgi:uncharacterized protein YndB with AHSA1/START domain